MLSAFVLPLYFILLMAATLVTALHAPAPHDLALTVAGPSATTSRLAAGIEQQAPGKFAVSAADTAAEARTAVLRRDAVGAVSIGGTATSPTVTTYVANASGRSAAAAVEAIGTEIATQLKTTSTVVDLAPLVAEDGLGTGTFYLITFSSIGGYLTLIVLTQVAPRARLSRKYLAALITGVLTPIIVFGLSSIFLGGFGLGFGALMAVLGVLALYVFTVALIVIMAEQLIGRAAIFLVAPLAIFLNLPSAGGASPESMLPGFWQALHSFWVGAGANEAIRDIVYFPGANPVRWIMQVLVWTIALLVITLFINGVRVIWRLQSVVIRTQRHAESLSEHVQLLSVPQQPKPRQAAITGGTQDGPVAGEPAPIAESTAERTESPDQQEQAPVAG